MIGLLIAIVVLAGYFYLLLRRHWTMRYPLYVVQYGSSVYCFRKPPLRVAPLYDFEWKDYDKPFRNEYVAQMQVYERLALQVNHPENIVRIAGI